MQKKVKKTESLKKTLSEKNKEISNLKAEVKTKDGLLVMAKTKAEQLKAHQAGGRFLCAVQEPEDLVQ